MLAVLGMRLMKVCSGDGKDGCEIGECGCAWRERGRDEKEEEGGLLVFV